MDLSSAVQTSTTPRTTTTTRSTTTTFRTTTTTRRSTTDRPTLFPTRPRVIGFSETGQEVTFHAAETDLPRAINDNFVAPNSNSNSKVELDKIFTEECLISEDCANADYCDLTTNTCKGACTLNGEEIELLFSQKFAKNSCLILVCGERAECRPRIHRPLCYCPPGYEGNPHVKCVETPSRAGTRFR